MDLIQYFNGLGHRCRLVYSIEDTLPKYRFYTGLKGGDDLC